MLANNCWPTFVGRVSAALEAGLADFNQCDLNRDLNQLIFCQKNQVI